MNASFGDERLISDGDELEGNNFTHVCKDSLEIGLKTCTHIRLVDEALVVGVRQK